MENNINWLSLLLSTLVPMVLGMIYYHKALFGKVWMSSFGLDEEKLKGGNMAVMMAGALVMAFLISFFLLQWNNGLSQEGEFDSFKHGAFHGVLLSLFVVIPISISGALFEHRSIKGTLVNGLYWLISLVIMSGIMDAMNSWPNVAGGM